MDTKKGKNKGLNAFLDKQVKKGKKKATTEEQKTETVQADTQEKQNIVQESEATQKPTKTQKQELSDEEVEENDLDLANQIQFGKVKEQKDVIQKKEDETQKANYGYDDTAVTGQVQEPKKNSFAKKDGPSEITFGGGRPKFGRAKKNTFADFKEGIDDIDLDGNVVKSKNKTESNTVSRADGRTDNFINMSSGGLGARAPRTEEESKNAFGGKPTGVRPTFTGRAKLNKAEPVEETGQAGIKSYDFKVSYSQKREENADGTQVYGQDKRNTGNRGVPFGKTEPKKEDDEFTFVSSQKRVRNTKPKNNDSESEGEEKNGAFTITRGPQRGQRGGMGRGGFE